MNGITFQGIDIAIRGRKDFAAAFVCDRGYDRSLVFEKFSSVHQHFLIRGKENRRIIAKTGKSRYSIMPTCLRESMRPR